MIKQRNDLDFFFMALHRLVVVAELTDELSDPRGAMPAARTRFDDRTAGMMLGESDDPATVASVRHALEHFQNLEIRGGLGFGRGGDRWYVSYRDRMFDTQELLDAALDLHLAIDAAVDPEAFMDFRADYPIIEVRDPAEIVNPYNPGVEIRHRTDAAMAEMAKRNT